MKTSKKIITFRERIEEAYNSCLRWKYGGGFDEILCYELHSQLINPRMQSKNFTNQYYTGLTFKELAQKWGISVSFLGELIADHCNKL